MSSSAMRGAVLVALAVLLGFLILRGAADNDQAPIIAGAAIQPTPTVDIEVQTDDAVPLATPTTVAVLEEARANSEVVVLVANGTTESGQAGRLTDALRNQGFSTREPETSIPQETSVIYYRPGFAAEAQVVRRVLGSTTPIAPMPLPDPNIGDAVDIAPANVLVLIGNDALSTS